MVIIAMADHQRIDMTDTAMAQIRFYDRVAHIKAGAESRARGQKSGPAHAVSTTADRPAHIQQGENKGAVGRPLRPDTAARAITGRLRASVLESPVRASNTITPRTESNNRPDGWSARVHRA
jgi:hypothetical protein